ncbi:MAG: acyl--CoA ligase [Rhodospirillaceae bacterium]|nr:acyl--CoA ligase [Rhodospirillaceae bacterium]
MARGLTRDQIGVTEEMIATFGDIVFRMSHNYQERSGDPVRLLDWQEIERQQENMGLSDQQIADRLGLSRDQVLFLRTVEERRRFRTSSHSRLLALGGGKRFRAERMTPELNHFRYSEHALALRAAIRFDPERAREYISRGWWRDDTVSKWLARHAAERPEAPAIVHAGAAISWQALSERVARLAGGLRAAGVSKGDVVAVQLPNIPEFLIAYFAICRLGGVLSTLHMPYRAAEIETLLHHNKATAAILLSEAKDFAPAAAVLAMRKNLPQLKAVIAHGTKVEGAFVLGDMIAQSPPLDPEIEPPVAADPFLLLYTSGTTAAPKGVPHNYHTMLSNARMGAPEHKLTAADRILSAAPFTHLFGLYSVHIAMAVGATTVTLPMFTPPDMAATIARDKPTALWTAPAHFAALRAQDLVAKHDFSSLKMMIMSGSACPPDLVRWTAAQLPTCAVTQLWGMTETQGALYSRPGDSIDIAANTAGRPSPGTEVRIADPDGRPCPPGEEGELQVRGCLLFPGFFQNPAANEAGFTADGWYRTGDLATADAAGNVAITGRSKDVINRGGVKFNPRDVEDLLDAHPAILQSAIIPMPDPVLGERACAFVTLRPGTAAPALDAVCAYLLEKGIAKIKLPERLVVAAEMPMTPTRKIIKGRLKLPD